MFKIDMAINTQQFCIAALKKTKFHEVDINGIIYVLLMFCWSFSIWMINEDNAL